MKSKSNCFNCKIHLNGDLIHDKDYITLKEIGSDIGLSYNIIADISSNRKKNHAYKNFKYQPQIDIKRINKNLKNVTNENLIINENDDY